MYDQIEAELEREMGLPVGGMNAIRTKGERSNANQVSPVGARTVYQIMPQTRKLFLDKYGVDAYANPESAARVAALHLKESMDRNDNSWEAAVGEYHGGPDRKRWGRINEAYRSRVLGGEVSPASPRNSVVPRPKVPTVSEMLGSTPGELFGDVEAELREIKRRPRPKKPSVSELVSLKLTEGMTLAPVNEAAAGAELQMRDATEQAVAEEEAITAWDRFKAGMAETLAGEVVDALSEQSIEGDPEFHSFYLKNWQDIESYAQNDREVAMLRDANSSEELTQIHQQIDEQREREKVIGSAASPTALLIGTGILDPLGWAAGLGVGKAAQLAGVGSRALAVAGRPGASLASAAGEGAVGNLAVTAGLDATGDYVDPSEYLLSALTGAGIGWAAGAASNRLGRDGIVSEQIAQARAARERYSAEMREQVELELGEGASPEQVTEALNSRIRDQHMEVLDYALADIPESQRLGVAEELLTQSDDFQARVAESGDLAGVADETERALVEETIARATRIDDANPVNKAALKTILAGVDLEATSTRLLLSDSPVARAVGVTLLENPQGAGGRQRTAAISQFMRERVYNEQFHGFDNLAHQFRKRENIGVVRDFWDGSARNQFNRRVFTEIERRNGKAAGTTFDRNPFVVEAADLFQAGMEKMRIEQQRAGTIGNARLGDNSVGYVPHRLDPRKVRALSADQMGAVRTVLARQFQEIEGFDSAFSDRLAARYLERSIDAANGMYQVPFNLHSPEAGQIVRDALEAMSMDPAEIDKIMGKFSRGGAGHTKRRLRLDLDEEIGDGTKLMDLFVTDVPALYRSYARRVSGEVALAQYGVMGKKGLDVLKKSMIASGASPKDVAAFDQIAAEFLNTPFGEANWNWMENIRLATSASRLGGMAFTQFAEFGNAIPALGVQAAFRSIKEMPRMMKEVREIAMGHTAPNDLLRSIDQMGGGVGMDDYWMTRMFDVRDNDVELYNGSDMGVLTRAVRGGAHANMILSGHRMIMAAQTRMMSEEVLRRAVKYAKSGADDTALDDIGITPAIRDALRKDMDKIAEFDSKGRVTKLDLFKGEALTPDKVNELAQAVERGSAQIIQRTFTGETGKWAHNGFLKMLFQFRTFSITAVEKQWGRNMRNYGAMKSFMYLMAAMSFALPIHMTRVGLKTAGMSEDRREKYLENNLKPLALTRATLNYASTAGLSGDIMDLGVSFASNYGGDLGESLSDSYGVRGKRADRLFGGVVAPGAGLADDLFGGTIGGDPHKLIRSLPGSNLPYVAPFITALRESWDE
ncbi:transglycosylase SLT domain-containing protein [Erythrobacter rubeus]|uniref:Transglycosylase SLT domain-containing protein n=1 Tax=Erythrobacter rubeus TaxID=2760803 RepID=A0ABR8KR08_9SPHN|nr:transglycosylase SLT domain-containing protein [Erythrobacter rubeus]MBD2841503.1 transglycosylase SLT domain-containing protein [Erythrobacter rubeus]